MHSVMDYRKDICQGCEDRIIPIIFKTDLPGAFDYVPWNVVSESHNEPEIFDEVYQGCTNCSTTEHHNKSQSCSADSACTCRKPLNFPAHQNVPFAECNPTCGCDVNICTNRSIFRSRLPFALEVFETKRKGFGVRSTEVILAGSFVCTYSGEVIDRCEAIKRFEALSSSSTCMNYIIVCRELVDSESKSDHHRNSVETIIDPTRMGNVGRFLNHSCNPNLDMYPIRIRCVVPELCLFAKRDIQPGEELTFHYSGDLDNCADDQLLHHKQEDYYKSVSRRKQCLCEATNCLGFLPLDRSLLV